MKVKARKMVSAKPYAKLTTGEVIRMLRDLKGWTQADLAKHSGISATNLSMLENDRVKIGKKRVEQLARALDVLAKAYGYRVMEIAAYLGKDPTAVS